MLLARSSVFAIREACFIVSGWHDWSVIRITISGEVEGCTPSSKPARESAQRGALSPPILEPQLFWMVFANVSGYDAFIMKVLSGGQRGMKRSDAQELSAIFV